MSDKNYPEDGFNDLLSALASKPNKPQWLNTFVRTLQSRDVTLETWNSLINVIADIASDTISVSDFLQILYKNCVWSVKGSANLEEKIGNVVLELSDFGINIDVSKINTSVHCNSNRIYDKDENLIKLTNDNLSENSVDTANIRNKSVTKAKLDDSLTNEIDGKVNKNYVDTKVSESESSLKTYTNTKVSESESSLKTYADNKTDAAKADMASYTDIAVAGIVNSAPGTLDTLQELSKALGDDPNFATTVATELGKKAVKTEVDAELAKKATKEELYSEVALTWENGSINGSSGIDADSTATVCRVVGYFDVRTIYSISVIKAKQLFYYDENKKYIDTTAITKNSTIYKSDILALGDVGYIRLRSAWGESAETVDKVTFYEDVKVKTAIEQSDKVDEKYALYTIKKCPMNWNTFFYNVTTGVCTQTSNLYFVSGDKIRLSEFVKAETGNNLYFRIYVYAEDKSYLGYLDQMARGGTLYPKDVYSVYPNASEMILSMYYSSNIPTPVADVEQYTTVYCTATATERATEDYWRKQRQRFNDKPIMVAYSNGADLGYINTEMAYINGAIAGFHWIKGDVQPTSDGKLVMCHDDGFTFDNNGYITTYNASSENTTAIHDMTYAECMAKEYAINYHIYTDYSSGTAVKEVYRPKVCDLEQFLTICKEYEIRPYIVIRKDYMDVVVPELLRLLEAYDFLDNCIVNSFELDSVKQVAEQSNHRVMISVVKEYASDSKLTVDEIDNILAVSPNCTINAYTSAKTDAWNNTLLMEASKTAIEYAKRMGVVVGTAFVTSPHSLFKKGVGLMQCSTACIPTKVTPINLCVALNNGVATMRRYGAYGAEYTADATVVDAKIELRNVRRIDSTRDFSDGITPNLAANIPYSLSAVGDNVQSTKLSWHNVIIINFDSNVADLDTSSEKRIFVKFAYGIDVMSQKASTDSFASKDEVNALKSDLDDLKSGNIQLTPLFANSIDECTDTTKLYVLPDGYIYAWEKTTVPVDPQPNFTNQLPISTDESGTIYNGIGYKEGYRVSSSGTEKVAAGYFATGFIPCTSKSTIRIKNATVHDGNAYCTVVYYNGNKTYAGGAIGYLDAGGTVGDDGTISFVTRESANDAYVRLTLLNVTAETIVTVNEEISYTEGGTTEAYAWANTGIAFVSGDANEKIAALETDVSQIKTEISKPLCTNVLSTATSADRVTIYEGVGYKTKTRLNSSGGEVEHSFMCVSGYIPVNTGDVLRIKGISPKTGSTSYIFAYNSENVKTGGGWLAQDGDPAYWVQGYYDSASDMFTIPLTANDFGSGFDAIRFSAGLIDANTIVTINEEISGSVFDVAKQNRDAISAIERATGVTADDTEQAAINRIKKWTYPIFEDAPVFLLDTPKSALSQSDYTTAAVYAKYDALMGAHSDYITREDCGLASDNSTHIYVYHFKESEPHYASSDWSETKPVLLICSGIHPTEMTGIYSLYNAMEEITTNSKLLDLRRNLHFVIMPIINPTGLSDATYGVRNPDGIQAHYNFEVDFRYPGTSGYVPNGNRNYGGETPLSIPETQYFDNLMKTYKDTIACVISCHNNDVDTIRGTGVIWCSCASNFTCNLGFRFVDKMSAAWRKKYGATFDEGVTWANAYALQKAEEGSSLFDSSYVKTQPSWDYRVGMASISSSGGTEYKQALKYGIHGLNVETCDRCLILDKDFSKTRTANVMTLGTETYINFFRTYMAVYDPKNKKDYAPNLPWTE